MSGTSGSSARPPLPVERPRFPAGTTVGGRKVGGQFMSDSIVAAAREGMVAQEDLDKAQKTIQDQQQQLDQVQRDLQDQQEQLDQVQRVVDAQQPSRMQRLASVASRTIAPIRALGPMGVLRSINRAASTGRSLINFDLIDNRRVAEASGLGYQRMGMMGGSGGLGTGAERVLFSISRDMSASRASLGRIENTLNRMAESGTGLGSFAPRDSREEKKDSSWLTALVAAGSALLTTFNALKSGVDRLVGIIGNLTTLLGRTLISGLTSLLSPTGVVGRALVTGAQLLFSGPGLAAVIGAGALAAIGAAIIRAMSMTPEEREAARMRAEEQAQAGREEMESTPAGNPGQAAARGIARSYNISTREYGDIQDILMNPRQGESPAQRAERERLNELQRQAERNAPGGNVQLAPGVADYIARIRAENAERDIEAGTAENRAIAESISPAAAFATPSQAELQSQGMSQRSEPQRAVPAADNRQTTAQRMMPSDERQVMITTATRMNDPRTVSLIENYAAMRGVESPAGGIIQDGRVVAVLDNRRRRVDVTDISRRDYSNPVEGDWSGTPQAPELAPPVSDNRSQTMSTGANQPTNVIVNNVQGGGQAAAAAPPAGRSTGTAAVGRSGRSPTHSPRPADQASAALMGASPF